jgi:hypothetical protein
MIFRAKDQRIYKGKYLQKITLATIVGADEYIEVVQIDLAIDKILVAVNIYLLDFRIHRNTPIIIYQLSKVLGYYISFYNNTSIF